MKNFKLFCIICLVLMLITIPYFNSIETFYSYDKYSFRTIRGSNTKTILKNFFSENSGRFFSLNSLKQEFQDIQDLELELEDLKKEYFITEISSLDFQDSHIDSKFRLFGIVRNRIISNEIRLGISDIFSTEGILNTTGAYFTEIRNSNIFINDLKILFNYFKTIFRTLASEDKMYLFSERVFPEFLEIYGDNLERFKGKLEKLLFNKLRHNHYKEEGENLEEYLNRLIQEERNSAIETEKYNILERDPVEKQKEIINILNGNISNFEKIFRENGDKFIGIMVVGSWGYLEPSPDSDIDIILITEGNVSVKSTNALKDQMEILLREQLNISQDNLKSFHFLSSPTLDISDPSSFDIFDFPGCILFIRNFILMTKDRDSFLKAKNLLIRNYHPHIFIF